MHFIPTVFPLHVRWTQRLLLLNQTGPDGRNPVYGSQDALLVKEKLHPDSVVVITSRDGALLRDCCSHVEPVSPLSEELAHELFASHAFKLKEMPAAVRERAAKVVTACGGLPLTLEVVTCQTPAMKRV